jgi:copper resistance protein C
MLRIPRKKHIVRSLLLLFLTVSVSMAFAHSRPVTMDPAADATTAPPSKVVIHFSEDLEPKFSSITVSNETGKVVNKDASAVSAGDAKLMTVALPSLPAGVYTVDWISVAVDSHRMQGSYKFTVK